MSVSALLGSGREQGKRPAAVATGRLLPSPPALMGTAASGSAQPLAAAAVPSAEQAPARRSGATYRRARARQGGGSGRGWGGQDRAPGVASADLAVC